MQITDHLQVQKYVAFLDVLGFKELVQEKGPKLNDYFEIIQVAIDDIRNDKSEIETQIVSDSIILACEISNENLGLLFKAVQTIQSRCALKNIWIRGGISIGDIYFNQSPNIIVGNGLVRAFLLESQAIYPRVVISPEIVQNFQTREIFIETYNKTKVPLIFQPNTTSKYIENDAFFIAFLERIVEPDFGNLDIIYNHLKSELYKGQGNYQKYLWLKNYFTEALSIMKFSFAPMRSLMDRNMSHEEALFTYNMKRFQSL